MTLIHEVDLDALKTYLRTENKVYTSSFSKVRAQTGETDRETDTCHWMHYEPVPHWQFGANTWQNDFFLGEFCLRLCVSIICYREKRSWYCEQITSSEDISIIDCKNRMIQKNFYTTLLMPLPIMLYNCCYNWCTGLFLLWCTTILLLLNYGLYVLMLSM